MRASDRISTASRKPLTRWAVTISVLLLMVAAAWAADFIPGDVNDDGVFDIADPTVLRRDLAGLGPGITQDVLCGNRVLDAGEECDSGVTCADIGSSFGSLDCGVGCVADVNTCTDDRFVDNGDGTISDNQTGLMWEKKVQGRGCLHCWDDPYLWADTLAWISDVNGHTDDPHAQAGLGGHTDWRLPTIVELQTILLDSSDTGLFIDSIFGLTGNFYWSSTTTVTDPGNVWVVNFFVRSVSNGRTLDSMAFVRAVRGGRPSKGSLGEGQPCVVGGECASGFCVEGGCCDSACSGLCESCLSTGTGSLDGTCAFITAGTDPDAECVTPQTCGGGGVPGACGCTPTTCEAEGLECEGRQDGCGGFIFCGVCTPGFGCTAGRCEQNPL